MQREDEGDMEINDSTIEGGDIDPGCYVRDIDIRGWRTKYGFVPIISECSNLPRNSTLKMRPTHCLPVLLSQVSQELVSFSDVIVTLVLLTSRILWLGKSIWRFKLCALQGSVLCTKKASHVCGWYMLSS
jgi:hypothetical protein